MLTRAGADAHEVDLALAAALTMNLTIVELQNALYAQQAAPTPEQQAQIDVHPDAAVKQLLALGVRDPLWLATVAQHHETHNGSGYPKRLAGDAIIRPAQWLLLADQYCALVSERAYRPGVNPATVMQKLREKPSPAFAPAALETLRQVVGTYPPGSVVELASREIALVTTRTQHPEHPIAVAIINDMGKRHEAPRKRPTSKPPFAIQKPLLQNALNPFPKVEELWHEAYVANG
jgi:HD-GYP domain-containing protein (c-di-GMP phosphodiesterase class II)